MKYLLTLIVIFIITYLAGSFIVNDFNTNTWGPESRAYVVYFTITGTLLHIAIDYLSKNTYDTRRKNN